MNPQLMDASSEALPVALEAGAQSLQMHDDARPSDRVSQTIEPFRDRRPAVDGLIPPYFHCTFNVAY